MCPFLAPSTQAALARLVDLVELAGVPEPSELVGPGELGEPAEPGEPAAAPPLERVRAIRRLVHELDADPATLAGVRDALGAGAGWDEIADAAGLKPAAARWRWSGSDEEIEARQAAGRKRSARPSSVPTELPGLSVAQAAATLGVTVQAVYLQVSRGKLASRTVELPDGRSYKRVFPGGEPPDATTQSPAGTSTQSPTERTRTPIEDGARDD